MRIRKNKPDRLLCSVVLLVVVVSGCFGIMAYYTYKDQILNVISVGFNEIRINEKYEPPAKMKPGIDITKEVSITNTGRVPCYVRVLAEYTNSKMIALSDVDFNDGFWVKNGDYYYYTEVLEPGQNTKNLFNRVSISNNVTEADLEAFDILIYAESKQGTVNDEYWQVWGVTPAS